MMMGSTLSCNDWRVRDVLEAEHLELERSYHEAALRLVLRAVHSPGVVAFGERDWTVDVEDRGTTVTVRRCVALTPGGYWIDFAGFGSRPPLTWFQSGDGAGPPNVTLYVSVQREKVSVPAADGMLTQSY